MVTTWEYTTWLLCVIVIICLYYLLIKYYWFHHCTWFTAGNDDKKTPHCVWIPCDDPLVKGRWKIPELFCNVFSSEKPSINGGDCSSLDYRVGYSSIKVSEDMIWMNTKDTGLTHIQLGGFLWTCRGNVSWIYGVYFVGIDDQGMELVLDDIVGWVGPLK